MPSLGFRRLCARSRATDTTTTKSSVRDPTQARERDFQMQPTRPAVAPRPPNYGDSVGRLVLSAKLLRRTPRPPNREISGAADTQARREHEGIFLGTYVVRSRVPMLLRYDYMDRSSRDSTRRASEVPPVSRSSYQPRGVARRSLDRRLPRRCRFGADASRRNALRYRHALWR